MRSMLAREVLRDSATEASHDLMFFHGDDALDTLRRSERGRVIERLHRVEMNNQGLYAFVLEHLRG